MTTAALPHVDVTDHIEWARVVAWKTAQRLPESVRDDAIQEGLLGLLQAALRWDPEQGGFRSYASARVAGAVIDHARGLDPVGRHGRAVWAARSRLALDLARAPTPAEIAAALDRPVQSVLRVLKSGEHIHTSLDEPVKDHGSPLYDLLPATGLGADEALEEARLRQRLHMALERFPGIRGRVLRAYFLEGQTLATIAAALGLTESRVSQLKTTALPQLHRLLEIPMLTAADRKKGATVARAKSLAVVAAWTQYRAPRADLCRRVACGKNPQESKYSSRGFCKTCASRLRRRYKELGYLSWFTIPYADESIQPPAMPAQKVSARARPPAPRPSRKAPSKSDTAADFYAEPTNAAEANEMADEMRRAARALVAAGVRRPLAFTDLEKGVGELAAKVKRLEADLAARPTAEAVAEARSHEGHLARIAILLGRRSDEGFAPLPEMVQEALSNEEGTRRARTQAGLEVRRLKGIVDSAAKMLDCEPADIVGGVTALGGYKAALESAADELDCEPFDVGGCIRDLLQGRRDCEDADLVLAPASLPGGLPRATLLLLLLAYHPTEGERALAALGDIASTLEVIACGEAAGLLVEAVQTQAAR